MYHIQLFPRQLHFKQPAGTSRGTYVTRDVWYIHLTSDQYPGRVGVGECAPLPNLSCDDVPNYSDVLARICAQVVNAGYLDTEALRSYPSILFGLETAFRHLETGSYALWDTSFSRGEAGIPINGLIWMGDYRQMLQQIEAKMQNGYRCIKLKIGAINFDEELALLRHIRAHFSAKEVELRVDANGAFSPEVALDRLHRLAELDLHSIEQPICAGQWEAMAQLVANTPLPIALDEELIGINDPLQKRQLLDVIHPQYMILKPSLHGGISGGKEWIEEAEKRNIGWWITSALESNIGLNAIAQWCATLPHSLPQGLGTGALFTDNVTMPLKIRKDCLWYVPASEQQITIDGKSYSPEEIHLLATKTTTETSTMLRDLYQFLEEWFSDSPTMTVQTSGSTGTPKLMTVDKEQMRQSARMTCETLHLKGGDAALLCMSLQYIAGKMMVVRALVAGLNLIVRTPSGHPLADVKEKIRFAAMIPLQVYNTMEVPEERKRLCRIEVLIIGGGMINPHFARKLRDLPGEIYATYGMTETLSHIALCRLNGDRTDAITYYPLPGVKLSLSVWGTLVIQAPLVCKEVLITNDVASIDSEGGFIIIGRKDTTIISGGIKMQPEMMEGWLQNVLPMPFAFTSIPDERLGEAVVMLIEGVMNMDQVRQIVTRELPSKYSYPKWFIPVVRIPMTGSGKIDRVKCKELAHKLLNEI